MRIRIRIRIRRRPWGLLVAPVAILVMAMLTMTDVSASTPVPGGQGTDTRLPATDSQVTVNGRDVFADLAITVNQTTDLTNQAVSITWTGGQPTRQGPGRFAAQYLQIMQCWGDDDGSVPGNPGPPPEQCEQGAVGGTPSGPPTSLYPDPFVVSRIISVSNWANFNAADGYVDTRTNWLWRPFRAVDGTLVNVQFDPKFDPTFVGGNYWLNSYFNNITTNEIAGAVTGPDGTGAELFEAVTGLQSSGLGCGQKTQPVAGGDKKIPKCWIVVVPRGEPAADNAGTPFEQNTGHVVTSPLSPSVWKNRIAIPIDFKPIDSPCSLSDVQRGIAGSELVLPAVASWQPALCAGGSLPPYAYATVGDASARQLLATSPPGAPGMVVVSRPLSGTSLDPASPVVYAPLSLSGVVIGYNIERNPTPDAPAEEQQLAGVRVAQLNLTPRLVAKLLTQSYTGQVAIFAGHPPESYTWAATNPAAMSQDPDFLQFNPEFALLYAGDERTFGGLQLPSGTSDAAQQLWEWVLADPEARAWLSGAADEWGMKVNPVYSTDAAINPTGGAFGDPAPNSFPKADAYCYQGPAHGPDNSVVPPPLCGTDWMPYNRGFSDGTRIARTTVDGAKISDNVFALNSSQVWSRLAPQVLGKRNMLSVTDTPSAAQYGIQMARLSRAGDNGPDRTFIAPDTAGLIAGAYAMTTRSDPTFLEPDPAAAAPAAYPLTALTYAAIKPLSLDEQARGEYAAFLEYAADPGQEPGFELGQLPQGYAVLPLPLRLQTEVAAVVVRSLVAIPPPPTTVPTTAPPTTTAPPATEAPVVTAPPTTTRRTNSTPPPTATTAPTTEVPVATEAPVSTDLPTTTGIATTTTALPVDETDKPPASGGVTPSSGVASSRFAAPGLGILALLSSLGALEITKRPRRKSTGLLDDHTELGEIEQA